VCVGRDVSDPITLSHTERLQGVRPTITSVEKLFVIQSQIAVHHSIAFGVELAGATRECETVEPVGCIAWLGDSFQSAVLQFAAAAEY